MSWIQENRFAVTLGGITAVAAIGLIAWGVSAAGSYSEARDSYTSAADTVDSLESGRLYPNDENLAGKKKAVQDYEEAVGDLQQAFEPYRTPTPPNVDPAAFNETLIQAKNVAADALTSAGTEIPPEFFLGSEIYTNSPVRREATGILSYQLEAISELVGYLAEAAPKKLINIHRPLLAEEEGQTFEPKDQTFRALPVEISFQGTEDSLRKFLSSLDDSEKFYYVIRTMRVMNEKKEAPTAADSQFQADEPEPAPGGFDDLFGGGGGFVLPGEEPEQTPEVETPVEGAPVEGAPAADDAGPAVPQGPSGEGEILQQVLGSELINVFIRFDILQFLEAPKA